METSSLWCVLVVSSASGDLDRAAEQELVRALRARGGRATVGDLVRDTGLPRSEVEAAVRTMLGLYKSHLAVDEGGELLYLFNPAMERRIKADDGLERLWAWCRKAFVFGFKFSTMLLLVAYVITFCVLIVAALVALMSVAEDAIDLDVGEGAGCMGFFGDLFTFWDAGDVLFIPIIMADSGASHGRAGFAAGGMPMTLRAPGALDAQYALDTYQVKRSRRPHFWDEVFAFVFGPQATEPPPLALEREVLDFIARNHGVLTLTELVSRTGMTVPEAQEELSRLLVRYDGDVEVTEGGELLYTFHELRVTAGGEGRQSTPAPPVWHRFETDQLMTGNSGGKNVLIGGMAAFTMVMSVLTPFLLMPILNLGAAATIPLAVVPFVMSLLYFAIPIYRSVGVSGENRQRRRRNARRAVLLTLFRHLSRPESATLTREDLINSAQAILAKLRDAHDVASTRSISAALVAINDADVNAVVDAVLTEMEAELDVDDEGRTLITLPLQRAELEAADAARMEASARDVGLGEIVYSSAEEDDDPLRDAIDDLEAPSAVVVEEEEEVEEEREVSVEETR